MILNVSLVNKIQRSLLTKEAIQPCELRYVLGNIFLFFSATAVTPQQLNNYLYVQNNSINLVDSQGLVGPAGFVIGIVAGAYGGFVGGMAGGNIFTGIIAGVGGAVAGGIVGIVAPAVYLHG